MWRRVTVLEDLGGWRLALGGWRCAAGGCLCAVDRTSTRTGHRTGDEGAPPRGRAAGDGRARGPRVFFAVSRRRASPTPSGGGAVCRVAPASGSGPWALGRSERLVVRRVSLSGSALGGPRARARRPETGEESSSSNAQVKANKNPKIRRCASSICAVGAATAPEGRAVPPAQIAQRTPIEPAPAASCPGGRAAALKRTSGSRRSAGSPYP